MNSKFTGDPKAGVAPNAGVFDVACEKLLPKPGVAVVVFDVCANPAPPPLPPNGDPPPNTEAVDVCCGEPKLVELPKKLPPEVEFVAPPKSVPLGDVALFANFFFKVKICI